MQDQTIKSTKKTSRIQINRSIISVIKAIASQHNYQNLSIKYKATDLIHFIYAEEESFLQLLKNLLVYAIKLVGATGVVSISHKTMKGRRHNDRNDFIKICIQIESERIEEELFQTISNQLQIINDSLSSKNGKKTTFDLAFCKRYLRGIGGDIWMKSDSPKRFTLHFTVPLVKEINISTANKATCGVIQSASK